MADRGPATRCGGGVGGPGAGAAVGAAPPRRPVGVTSITAPPATPRRRPWPSSSRSSTSSPPAEPPAGASPTSTPSTPPSAHAGLGADQAAAVRAVTRDGDTVTCVVGPAGRGQVPHHAAPRPTAWAASAASRCGAWRCPPPPPVCSQPRPAWPRTRSPSSSTNRTVPAAPTRAGGSAAAKCSWSTRPAWSPSADLARLVLLADQATAARWCWSGDGAQLGAVEAGGLFRLLANDHGDRAHRCAPLPATTGKRDASLRLRARDPAVLAVYEQHGRVVGGDRDAMVEEAFARWQTARAPGRVGGAVRQPTRPPSTSWRCAARPPASPPGKSTGSSCPPGTTRWRWATRSSPAATTGASITTGGGWVRNGDRWTVPAVHRDGAITVDDAAGRGRLRLPADYVAERRRARLRRHHPQSPRRHRRPRRRPRRRGPPAPKGSTSA